MKCHLVAGVLMSAALLAGVLLPGCAKAPSGAAPAAQGTEHLYTCGMHPQIIRNKPGNCPICGMKLTPVRQQPAAAGSGSAATGERRVKFYKSTMTPGETSQSPGKDSMGMEMVPVFEEPVAGAANTITIDPVTTQNMNLRTGLVTKGPVRRVVRTVGVVDFDETTLAEVSTKFKGWIEKLNVDAVGKQVHAGEPLFEIYAPELYSAQAEYVLALGQTGAGADTVKASAATKLKFFDISDDQIAELEKTRQPKKTLRVQSPRDGIVVEKLVVQGQMVDSGMKLFRIADLGTVWLQAQVYEQDLPLIELGQEAVVTLSYLPDRRYRGRVTYIYPTVDDKTRTARVRMEFHNPGFFLKPGMFATVELRTEIAGDAVLIPDSAVLRSGETNTVFVALAGGRFEARAVTLGVRAENGQYQVLSGVKEGEKVVTSAQFMLDSESQLREAIAKMGAVPGPAAPAVVPPVAGGWLPEGKSPAPVYLCPMPEHVSITYKEPGKCPLCGMTLVPVSAELLAQIQPVPAVDHYTCPMPEHAAVHEAKPGKCPLCGMTLVPVMKKTAPTPAAGAPAATATESAKPPAATGAVPAPTAKVWYVCPMPEDKDVRSDKPGKCPKCGMDLLPEKK